MKWKIDFSKLKGLGLSLKTFKKLKALKSPKSPKKMPSFLQKIKIKRSKSSALSLSKRDLILLGLLIIGLEGYGLYHFFLSSKWLSYSSLQARYAAEQVIATNFEKDMAQKNQYLENLKLLEYKLGVLTQEIPPEIPQEEIVLSLNNLAKARELDISGIAFSTISAVTKQDFAAGKTAAQPQDNRKVITPTSLANDSKAGSGTTATSTANDSKTSQAKPKLVSNMVLVEDVDITYAGNYGALYNFISDLEKSERKIIVKEVNMIRMDGNILKGTLKIQYVGYWTSEDKSTYSLDTPPVNGKTSPFLAYLGFEDKDTASKGTIPAAGLGSASGPGPGPGPAPIKTYNPNFFLLLNTYDDSAPKIIMRDFNKNGTELYSNLNGSVKGKLVISGNSDTMTYAYSLGGTTQTKNAKLMIDGGKLQLEVISKARKNEQDKVSLTLDVDNKTDYPLEITVLNDDKQAPRFSLGTQLGSVTVK